jgi:excisionase family DNA binding protein
VSTLLLTTDEAASELSLSRSVVYDLIGTGAIRSIKVGRSRRILRSSLEAFVNREVTKQLSHESDVGQKGSNNDN